MKETYFQLRLRQEDKDTLKRAAEIAEVSVAEFIRRASIDEARKVIKRAEKVVGDE